MNVKGLVAKFRLKRNERKTESNSFDYPSALQNPKRVLVCLPGELRELTMVKQFLPTISKLFTGAEISLLTEPDLKVADIIPRKGFHVLSPGSRNLTWSGLPKKAYLEELRSQKFDLVLDLNLEPSTFMAGVLLAMDRSLKIGRGNFLGRPYYNLEIKTRYLRDGLNIYRSLLETLGTVKGTYEHAFLKESQ